MKTPLITVVLALACAGYAASSAAQSTSATVTVTVTDGRTVMSDKEWNLAIGASTITWVLGTRGYLFRTNGVVLNADSGYSCGASSDRRSFRCTKARSRSAGVPADAVVEQINLDSTTSAPAPQPDVWIMSE